jgi:hypothetical protein
MSVTGGGQGTRAKRDDRAGSRLQDNARSSKTPSARIGTRQVLCSPRAVAIGSRNSRREQEQEHKQADAGVTQYTGTWAGSL